MCSRTTQKEKPKRKFTQNRDWENEFVLTYHSCELAYFNPSMTVLYICTPLARLNKGANAVVLEVNCFKVCLSAMMKSCVVVRVKCDDRSVPPLFHLSLSEGRIARSRLFRLFFCVFYGCTTRSRENTSLDFFFWISSLFGRNKEKKKKKKREFFCVSAPLPPLCSPFAHSHSLSRSLSRERKKKNNNSLCDALFLFPHL